MRLLTALLIASECCFAQSSELLVKSNPTDATVSINGIVVGRTPLVVPMTAVGFRLEVQVKKDGFRNWNIQTFSSPGQSVLEAELQKVNASFKIYGMEKQHDEAEPTATLQSAAFEPQPIRSSLEIASQKTSFPELVLHEGTPVRMQINRTVSSASATPAENVDFETLDDVKINDFVVIPRGSTAIATVIQAVPKGHMGKGGKLGINIDYVRLPNGDKLPLRGVENLKGGGHGGAMTGGMIATAIVFWPAAPLFLFMHGKDIDIPKGHEVTVYTNSDFKTAQAVQAKATEIRPAVASSALTNADVLRLRQAGFGEPLIVEKIKTSQGNYQLGTDELMSLKKAGLSDAVLAAMMEAGRR
jgi:hypothetical protein